MATSSAKNGRLYFATAFIAVLLFFILGEILVRFVLPFNTPDTVKRYSLPYVGSIFARHRLKPLGRMVENDSDKALGKKKDNDDSGSRWFINDAGYRGPNFSRYKPEGIIRIIVVGGSTVFDGNARDPSADETRDWPHLIERFLRDKGHNAEVINAGIPGHASFDALGRLYSQLWIYQPDYVLLYDIWNDLKYFRTLTPENPLIAQYKPFNEKSDPFTEYQGPLDRFFSNFQIYVKLRNQYYGWKFNVGPEGAIPAGDYQDSYSPDAVKQYRLNVELIVDLSRNIKATPILLTEATLVSPNNSAEDRKMINYHYELLTHSALVRAYNEVYEVIKSVGQEKTVGVLDLAKDLNGKNELFIDSVHLSTKGSEEVARRVAEFLALDLKKRVPPR